MMKFSIVVFGSEEFFSQLPHHLLDASDVDLEVFVDLHQAVSRIKNVPPDVIIAQASAEGCMKICHWLKTQPKLCWIHYILLEDRPQQLMARKHHSWEWELEMTANVLEQGADAYIWQVHLAKINSTTKDVTAYHSLLLAQLMLGVHKAQKYRDVLQTNDLLSGMALADALTEMSNRRALEWELPRQIIKARTKSTPLSVMMLDVDYFKQVNDNYGHLVGDRLLQLLCTRLRNNLRSQDTAFRYGGEEFVVILPKTNQDEALRVAQRLNCLIAQDPFKINNKVSIRLTVSLGVASLQRDDDVHGSSLLYRADQYLLQAKTAGRNQVVGRDYSPSTSHLKLVSS